MSNSIIVYSTIVSILLILIIAGSIILVNLSIEIKELKNRLEILGTYLEREQNKVKDEQRELKNGQMDLWRSALARGQLEAIDLGHIVIKGDGSYDLSQKARDAYTCIRNDLRALRKVMVRKLGREPTDVEFQRAVELTPILHKTLIEKICPVIGTKRYGCLSIASVIAKEDSIRAEKPITESEHSDIETVT